ncbi:hypothetical protein U1Q18_013389 [Sarracenia purpurea var. burkii]
MNFGGSIWFVGEELERIGMEIAMCLEWNENESSHFNLLYMLSPSKLSFSLNLLHLTWHHVEAPLVWRVDPIVVAIGRCVVVAGGTYDFEDDPLAVEIYDVESRT